MMNIIKYFVLSLLVCSCSVVFSQELVEKEFAVVSNKDLVITEMPDISSGRFVYERAGIAVPDTFEIVDRNKDFYQVAFTGKDKEYLRGWVSQSEVTATFKVEQVYRFESDREGVKDLRNARKYKSNPEWNAVIHSVINNGEIVKGMNSAMVTASVGKPDGVNKYFTSGSEIQQWTYNRPPHGNYVLTFENDVFNSVTKNVESLSVKFQEKLAKRKKYPYRVKGVELMALGGATFILTYAFLRDDDNKKSVLFQEKHRTFSWVVASTFVVAESVGLYLFFYEDKQNKVSMRPAVDGVYLSFTHHF
ncbi:hypothetical protein KAS50_02275 [bacterium]|nr:hypothetical protein [bacterium]